MNIEQLNERVAKEQYVYDKIVRRRAMIRTPETIARIHLYIYHIHLSYSSLESSL